MLDKLARSNLFARSAWQVVVPTLFHLQVPVSTLFPLQVVSFATVLWFALIYLGPLVGTGVMGTPPVREKAPQEFPKPRGVFFSAAAPPHFWGSCVFRPNAAFPWVFNGNAFLCCFALGYP